MGIQTRGVQNNLARTMLASQFRLPGERKKNSADCTMNKKNTNIYFPVLVIIIFLVFVADHKSAMVKLYGKEKRERLSAHSIAYLKHVDWRWHFFTAQK